MKYIGVRWAAILACLLLFVSGCTTQSSAPVPTLDLASMTINAETTGLQVTGQADRSMVASDLYHMSGSAGDTQRSNFVQGFVRDYRITELTGGELIVRLVAYRTASWAQGCVNTETPAGTDLGEGRRIAVLTQDTFRGLWMDGVKGRLRITILLSTTDQNVDPEKVKIDDESLAPIVERIWQQQANILPDSSDIPADVGYGPAAVGRHLALEQGIWSTIVMFTIMVIGGAAGVLRDRGSREALASMLVPCKKATFYPQGVRVIDLTSDITGRNWVGFLQWFAKAVVMSAAIGLLMYALPHWWLTFSIMAAAIAITNILQTFLRRNEHQESTLPHLNKMAQGALITGTVVAALVVAAGVFLIIAGVTGGLLLGGIGMVVIIIPMILLGMAVSTRGRSVSRFVQRLIQPAVRQAIESDPREPVMLLRSFQDDSLEVRAAASVDGFTEGIAAEGYARFEEIVAHSMLSIGPVVALGQPGTILQPLGAARDYYTDDEWQDAVENRANQAGLLLLIVGRSPALMWEIDNIRAHARLAKTLFVFPPVAQNELTARIQTLRSSLGLSIEVVPDIPIPSPLVLHFTEDGTPCLHVCAARVTQAYERVIHDAAIETAQWRAQPLTSPALVFQGSSPNINDLLVHFDPAQAKKPRRTLASILSDIASRL